jgi:ABC-2 type transport system permease protein
MNSKTSFFNRTVFFKNIRRFGVIWILYAVCLFFLCPFIAYLTVPHITAGNQDVSELAKALSMFQSPVHVIIFAILAASAVFSYLCSARSCNMTHALPFSRRELYITNYISGLLFLILPQAVNFFIALPAFLRGGLKPGSQILPALGYVILVDFILYSIAVFCCMLSAHYIGGAIYYAIVNLLYAVLRILFSVLISMFTFGAPGTVSMNPLPEAGNYLSPAVYITTKTGMDIISNTPEGITQTSLHYYGWTSLLGYCVVAAVLIICGMFLYRHRQLECAGDVSAFPFLRPVSRWIIGFTGGIGFAYFFSVVIAGSDAPDRATMVRFLILYGVFCLIWFFITEMVLKKTVRVFVRRMILEWVIFATATTVLLAGIILGYCRKLENTIPDTSEVTAAVLSTDYPVLAENASQIDQIRDLQQTILDHRSTYQKINSDTATSRETAADVINVTIGYQLKNGKTVIRSYAVPLQTADRTDVTSVTHKLETIQSDYTQALNYLFCTNYNHAVITNVTASDKKTVYNDGAQEIFNAVIKDYHAHHIAYTAADSLEGGIGSTEYSVPLELKGTVPGAPQTVRTRLQALGGKKLADEYPDLLQNDGTTAKKNTNGTYTTSLDTTITLTPECKYTIAALKKNGVVLTKKDFAAGSTES